MRELKIRFIESIGEKRVYSLQVKKWYGWKTQGYTINLGHGSLFYEFYSEDKEDLLNVVLAKNYNTVKKFVKIIEYPQIKQY